MSLTSISNCPICSSSQFVPFLSCTDHTTSGEEFQIKTCTSCGLAITDPSPDKASIGKYYLSDKYISHTGGGKSLFEQAYVLARKVTLRWKRSIVEDNTDGKSILDVGCGTGEFLKEIRSRGWTIAGVEPSAVARLTAEENITKNIYEQLAHVHEQDFDAITLWHVLEHLHDLNETMQRLKALLKKTGTIFIAVPNHEAYDAAHYKKYWAGFDVPRHLWHFKQNDVKRLLEQHDFKLIKTIPMRLDAFYVSLLSESYQHPTKNGLLRMLKATLVGLKSNAKAKSRINYSSLIYVAKK